MKLGFWGLKMSKTVTRILSINIDRHLTTEQKIILGHLTYSASKLWNIANYEVLENKTSIYELKAKLKGNLWYKNLHSQSAQAVIEKLQIAWKNCFKKYTKRPKYRPKDGHLSVIWKKNGIKLIDRKLRLSLSKQTKEYLKKHHGIESTYLWVELPKILPLDTVVSIRQVEVVPYQAFGHISYTLHVIYKKQLEVNCVVNHNKTLAIDLGVSNLVTATDREYSFIIDGRTLVSKMRLFAKKRARLQSVLSKQKLKTSKRFHRLYVKERNFVNDYLHKVSKKVVDYCLKHRIGTIAIGAMHKGITNMNIGSQNNEKLHRIPFGRLARQIKYKAEEYGIKVTSVDESYTSQTCCVCGNVDKNNRKHRGLYVCENCGTAMNADVNGALNILKRVVPNLFSKKVGIGVLANPVRIRIFDQSPYEGISVF